MTSLGAILGEVESGWVGGCMDGWPGSCVLTQSDNPSQVSRWVGWLAGWLVGWLAGWLAGWLIGWLVGWLAGWFGSDQTDPDNMQTKYKL